jgi:hypothetical protein
LHAAFTITIKDAFFFLGNNVIVHASRAASAAALAARSLVAPSVGAP